MTSLIKKFFALCGVIGLFSLQASPLSAWEQEGVASWYGGDFQGKLTANGEIYDTYTYTCAHKTLPFNTLITVKNLSNNHLVRVRVNDRGPFVDNRIIDLSYAAAQDLGMLREGTTKVRLTVEESSFSPVLFRVQVGAWRDRKNISAHRARLEEAELNPVLLVSEDGVTRLVFVDIQEKNIFPLVNRLENLGYQDLLVLQM